MIRHPEVNVSLTYVNDQPRIEWYRDALANTVKDRTVFEIGTGVGLLGAYCLELGASHYYGIDIRSGRVQITRHVLDQMGYANKHTISTADFLSLTRDDVPQGIDVLLCEQIGSQFTTHTTIKKIWSHANDIFSQPYVSVPDTWAVDVAVYEGQIQNDLPDFQPSVMLNFESFPKGFYKALNSTNLIEASENYNNIVDITPASCDQPTEFVLDLTEYKSATVVIKDHISYQGSVCQGISYTKDWPHPHKIVIPKAGKAFKFSWDPAARCLPDFYNGFWTWSEV